MNIETITNNNIKDINYDDVTLVFFTESGVNSRIVKKEVRLICEFSKTISTIINGNI